MRLEFLLPTVALFGVATGGLHPLVSLGLARLGEGELIAGLVTAAFYLGAFSGAVGCRRAVRSLGYRRSLLAIATIASISTAALSVSDSWPAWMILRLIAGCALGAYYVTVESWIIRITQPSKRSINLAAYETARLLAVASGPAILSVATFTSGYIGAALAMMAGAIPVLVNRETPPAIPATQDMPAPILAVASRAPVALAACLMAGVYAGSFYGLGALFVSDLGWTDDGTLMFMTAVLLAPVLTQVPLGMLADRFGRRPLLLVTTGVAMASGAGLSVGLGGSDLTIFASAMLFGGACYPLYALGVGLMSEALEPHEAMTGNGLTNVAYNIGAIGGPIASGTLMALSGSEGLYIFLTVMVSTVPFLLVLTSDIACLRPGCCSGPS